jgi:hypothetical protein
MPDPLYLSLWFPSFDTDEMMPRALAVLLQFPFSSERPGVLSVALHPVSWNEATILERRFNPGAPPAEAVEIAADLLHDDYAYVFEVYWDLWILSPTTKEWALQPSLVEIIVRGPEFDEAAYEQEGEIEMDIGLDSPFLQEDVEFTSAAEAKIRANIQKLVELNSRLEKSAGASARLLWSESDESLAQKLVARLQKVQ